MSRNGVLLQNYFKKIDVCDIKPSFGKIPKQMRGMLFKTNLKDIGDFVDAKTYDLIFANWGLCYIGFKEIQ